MKHLRNSFLFITAIFLGQLCYAQDDDINFSHERWPNKTGVDITIDSVDYDFNIDSTAVRVKYYGREKVTHVHIPDSISFEGNKYPVYMLGYLLFSGDPKIESIIIECKMPKEVGSMFYYCYKLREVKIPDYIESIGSFFLISTKVKHFEFPKNLKRIGGDCFTGTNLETIIVNDSLEYLEQNSVLVEKLQEFRIPATVTYMRSPFLGGNLRKFVFDDGNADLRTLLSGNLPKLEYLYCGRKSMNPGWGFPCLKELVIGEPVRILELKNISIEDAGSLKVYARSTSPQDIYLDFGDSSDQIYSNSTLVVPKGTRELYMATEGWKNFAKIVEGDVTGITSVQSDTAGDGTFYDLNGRRLADKPAKGIYIQNGKKVVIK